MPGVGVEGLGREVVATSLVGAPEEGKGGGAVDEESGVGTGAGHTGVDLSDGEGEIGASSIGLVEEEAGAGAAKEPGAFQAGDGEFLLDEGEDGPGPAGVKEGVDPGVAKDDTAGGVVAGLEAVDAEVVEAEGQVEFGAEEEPIDLAGGIVGEGKVAGGEGGRVVALGLLDLGEEDAAGSAEAGIGGARDGVAGLDAGGTEFFLPEEDLGESAVGLRVVGTEDGDLPEVGLGLGVAAELPVLGGALVVEVGVPALTSDLRAEGGDGFLGIVVGEGGKAEEEQEEDGEGISQ